MTKPDTSIVVLCKDCKWCFATLGDWSISRCRNPNIPENRDDFMTSGKVTIGHYAGNARRFEDSCGNKAKYFEPRENKGWWKLW